ncbi:MAG: DUF3006 domain-containing protein [Clostridia bacterium]|nr:DUF3006 domain-containing protein [Clostridia bacterium]
METKRYVIDRIEGEYAVCTPDDGSNNIDIPCVLIDGVREGLMLDIAFRDDSYRIDVIEDDSRKEANHNRLKKLFNKSESGKNED